MNRKDYLLTTSTAVLALLCMTGANTLSTITLPDQPNTTLAVSTLPHVATNALLKTHPIADFPNGVIRDDYATGNGAPQLFYLPSNAACSIASGAGDNGSQVQSSDSKCWLAQFPAAGVDAREFGADATATTSSSTALQNCMNAGGLMNVCSVAGYSILISGSVTIPASNGISCGWAFGDVSDVNISKFNNIPSIILASGSSLLTAVSGESPTITNCVIRPNGMTFPASHASAFTGTAIQDTAIDAGGITIKDSVILGFDSCIYTTGSRPVIDRVYCDGEGVTHAAIDVSNNNTDGGYIDKIKIQPLATGNYGNVTSSCSGVTRAGTGLRIGGINFYGQVVVQNYQASQIEIDSPVPGGILWADFPYQCANTYPNSTGVVINPGNPSPGTWIDQLNLNGMGIGLAAKSGVSHVNLIFANVITGDCIQLGVSGVSSAYLKIGNYSTNNGNTTATSHNCGNNAGASGGTGFALNWKDSTTNSFIQIDQGHLNNIASTPYINIPNFVAASQVAISDRITSDLANPATLYGTTTLNGTTGLGSGGSAAFTTTTRTTPWKGVVHAIAGTSPAVSGSVALAWPLTLNYANGCKVTYNDGNFFPTPPVSIWMQSIDATHSTIFWALGSNPPSSGTMDLNFTCDPQ